LDTVYKKLYIPKTLMVSSLFPFPIPFPHQKTLDKPKPLAYKKEVTLDTVYKILTKKGGFHGNDIRRPSDPQKEIPTGRSL
jgi:hypothetical protein